MSVEKKVSHTPGPWKVIDDLDIIGALDANGCGVEVATCGTSIQEFYETAIANALLIASAPDMLAAIDAWWEDWDNHYDGAPLKDHEVKLLAARLKAKGI